MLKQPNPLATLSDPGILDALRSVSLRWEDVDANACSALRFREAHPEFPLVCGFLGGASCGKSTLFNTILGREASRITAHAHETVGPIAAVHERHADKFLGDVPDNLIFTSMDRVAVDRSEPTSGRKDRVEIICHRCPELEHAVIVDLPDITSTQSASEGGLALNLLPWLDVIVVVLDEERWFDATVLGRPLSLARLLGPTINLVFNCTEISPELEPSGHQEQIKLAARLGVADWVECPFKPGTGYRPVDGEIRDRLIKWVCPPISVDRIGLLHTCVRQRCSEMLRANLDRVRQFENLSRGVSDRLRHVADDTRLTEDLLTSEERSLLGIGQRMLPLYSTLRGARQVIARWMGQPSRAASIDFEKEAARSADALRQNYEQRFHAMANVIDRWIAEHEYWDDEGLRHRCPWEIPPFDAAAWGRRVRTQIDAWKVEVQKHSRQGDAAALAIGLPLLLADLLFFAGSGTTVLSATAWIAGMVGGKGVVTALRRSPAFADYRTTVQAYQALVREGLETQCERIKAALPRRHLPMSHAAIQAAIAMTSQGRSTVTQDVR